MKKQLETWFITVDGARFQDENAARERELTYARLLNIMAPLGPTVSDIEPNGDAFARHSPEVLIRVKSELIELTRPHLGEWLSRQEKVHGKDPLTIHSSWFERMLDGGNRPLENAWYRFSRIDDTGREWGQPYYANNPDKGGDTNITPSAHELSLWIEARKEEARRIIAELEEPL